MENSLYFRFSRKSITWNSEAINAELQNYSDEHMKIQREWWYGKPLSTSVPMLRFAIPEDGPMPDNYWNATLFDLYSSRLTSILEKAGISHELYPVEVVGKKSGDTLPIRVVHY